MSCRPGCRLGIRRWSKTPKNYFHLQNECLCGVFTIVALQKNHLHLGLPPKLSEELSCPKHLRNPSQPNPQHRPINLSPIPEQTPHLTLPRPSHHHLRKRILTFPILALPFEPQPLLQSFPHLRPASYPNGQRTSGNIGNTASRRLHHTTWHV